MPLRCFQRPNTFQEGREACNPQHEGGVPYDRCGFYKGGHVVRTQQGGRGSFALFLVIKQLFDELFVHGVQLLLVVDVG